MEAAGQMEVVVVSGGRGRGVVLTSLQPRATGNLGFPHGVARLRSDISATLFGGRVYYPLILVTGVTTLV